MNFKYTTNQQVEFIFCVVSFFLQ